MEYGLYYKTCQSAKCFVAKKKNSSKFPLTIFWYKISDHLDENRTPIEHFFNELLKCERVYETPSTFYFRGT